MGEVEPLSGQEAALVLASRELVQAREALRQASEQLRFDEARCEATRKRHQEAQETAHAAYRRVMALTVEPASA